MKKKTVALIVLALIVVAGAYIAVRMKNRGTDIIGVTTLYDRNTVIMNAKTGQEFVSGRGTLTVGEGERVHMEYDLSAGALDIAFFEGGDNAPLEEDMSGGLFGQEGVSGKGALDFDAAPGSYSVQIAVHDAVGRAVVTTKAH